MTSEMLKDIIRDHFTAVWTNGSSVELKHVFEKNPNSPWKFFWTWKPYGTFILRLVLLERKTFVMFSVRFSQKYI